MQKYEVEKLVEAHLQWRSKLLRYVYSGLNCGWVNSQTIGNPNLCTVGQILNTVDTNADPLFSEIIQVHQQVHLEAKRIFDLMEANKKTEAEALLNVTTSLFLEYTMQLTALLRRLNTPEVKK